MNTWIKLEGREKRQRRIRKKSFGTKDKPRLNVYRSLNHMYAQLIDDENGKTLLSVSTLSPDIRKKSKNDCGNVKGASLLGGLIAQAAAGKGITSVVFDRAGYAYHGRVKALAEAARKGGLKF